MLKLLFKSTSLREKGTLYHLKILLNQTRVVLNKSKIKDFNACDDFFKLTVSSYVVAAAMKLLNMSTMDAEPANTSLIPDDAWVQGPDERRDTLYAVSSMIVKKFVDLKTDFTTTCTPEDDDKVLEYSRLVLSLGLLYLEYCDAIKEGDGFRVLRCWKYNFLIFKCTNRINYSIEAFTLLAQHCFLFSERQAHQLLWGRFINTHGLPARNIPCDLYMEHLNRVCKDVVSNLKANKTPKALVRVGKVVGILDDIAKNFDDDNFIHSRSGKHKVASYKKDLEKIVTVLMQEKVLTYTSGRVHPSFQKIVRNPIQRIDHEQLLSWMYIQLNHLIHGF